MSDDIFRARDWSSYIGQPVLKQRLDVHINAALGDQRMLDHVLLYAPPGSGKTTLAKIIADRLGDDLLELTMPLKPAVFASILRQWQGGILFLDEIHAASKREQEDLLPLLERGRYEACRPGMAFEHLTVIGATTEPEKVIAPLFDRFPIKPAFEPYTTEEMGLIVQGMADRIGMNLDRTTCEALARATGGIPRQGRQFVLAARDLQRAGQSVSAESILALCGYEEDGLDGYHIQYLNVLRSSGGRAGLTTIASHLRLNPSAIRNVERLLVQLGYVNYGERGRELSQDGWMRLRRGKTAA